MKQWLKNLWRTKVVVPHKHLSDHFEHQIDHNEWRKLLSYAESLGLRKQPDSWSAHNIQKGYYDEHSFYFSFECNAPVGVADAIKEYMDNMPRLSEEDSRSSEAQSDRCLSAGATMGSCRSNWYRKH